MSSAPLELAKRLGITEENLAIRRELIDLGADDAAVLQRLVPWIESAAPDLARRFYDQQFAFAPTARFFARHAERKGVGLDDLRGDLERAQADYIANVFRGARTGWDVAHFGKGLHVGTVHVTIDLPLKWFVGSYCIWRQLLTEALTEHLADRSGAGSVPERDRPRRRAEPPPAELDPSGEVLRVMASVEKVFNLDLQAISDSFLMTTLRSIGMGVDTTEVEHGTDRTERVDRVREDAEVLQAQAEALASDVMDVDVLDQEVDGAIGEGFAAAVRKVRSVAGSISEMDDNLTSISASAEQLGASSNEIAARAAEVVSLTSDAVATAGSATSAVNELSASSEEINKVVGAIANVAAQTNLLALNATIEAARAGEAGKGFSVVANEVKELAGQTASATVSIERQIMGIRDEIGKAVDAIGSVVERIQSVDDLQTTMAGAIEEQSIAVNELGTNLARASGALALVRDQVRLSTDADPGVESGGRAPDDPAPEAPTRSAPPASTRATPTVPDAPKPATTPPAPAPALSSPAPTSLDSPAVGGSPSDEPAGAPGDDLSAPPASPGSSDAGSSDAGSSDEPVAMSFDDLPAPPAGPGSSDEPVAMSFDELPAPPSAHAAEGSGHALEDLDLAGETLDA